MASEMYRTYKFTTVGTCLAATVVHEICVPEGGAVPQVGVRYYAGMSCTWKRCVDEQAGRHQPGVRTRPDSVGVRSGQKRSAAKCHARSLHIDHQVPGIGKVPVEQRGGRPCERPRRHARLQAIAGATHQFMHLVPTSTNHHPPPDQQHTVATASTASHIPALFIRASPSRRLLSFFPSLHQEQNHQLCRDQRRSHRLLATHLVAPCSRQPAALQLNSNLAVSHPLHLLRRRYVSLPVICPLQLPIDHQHRAPGLILELTHTRRLNR